MALHIYNTLAREKQLFEPLVPGRVRMYVCGVTVYGHCHVGHARAYICFDVMVRWLRQKGLEVEYVRNFTDVDDNIIRVANERGATPESISQQYIDAFHEDMIALGLLPADIEPRATEHIAEMIEIIEALLTKKHAYAVEGDVYFAVPSYPPYGRLSRRNLEPEEERRARVVEPDDRKRKRDPSDFALWKAAKPGEPYWDSPWGKGRPGWHIECSAMSRKHLGQPFDLHGGGEDLVFPHHENEIAQSEAAFGVEMAKYWVHNAFINMGSEKMSRSVGNVKRVREELSRFPGEALRMLCLSAHYRTRLDYTDQGMFESIERLDRLYRSIEEANQKLATHRDYTVRIAPAEGSDADAARKLLDGDSTTGSIDARFTAAMDDDFNTAEASSLLFEAARLLNRFTSREMLNTGEWELANRLRSEMRRLGRVLGILEPPAGQWLAENRSAGVQATGLTPADIEAKIAERKAAREARDFKKADEVRDWLKERSILLEDGPGGTTIWRLHRKSQTAD